MEALIQENQRLMKKITILEKEISRLRDVESSNIRTTAAIKKDYDDRMRDLQKQNQDLQWELKSVHRSTRAGPEAEEIIRDLKQKLLNCETTNRELREANRVLRERRESSDTQAANLRRELLFVQSEKEWDSKRHNPSTDADLMQKLTQLRAKVESLSNHNYTMEQKNKELENNYLSVQTKCDELKKDKERLERYSELLKSDLESSRQARESLASRIHEEEEVRRQSEIKLAEQERKIASRSQHMEKWEEERYELSMKIDEMSKKLSHSEKKCEVLQGEIKALKKERGRIKPSSDPDMSYTISKPPSNRSKSGDQGVYGLVNQQTVLIANLQQQMFNMQEKMTRMHSQNTHYQQAAGQLNSTLTSRQTRDEKFIEDLARKVRDLIQIEREDYKSALNETNISDQVDVSSRYPPLTPFFVPRQVEIESFNRQRVPSQYVPQTPSSDWRPEARDSSYMSMASCTSVSSQSSEYSHRRLDKNLTCPYCGLVFFDGELIKCRKHSENCISRPSDS